MKMTKLIYLFAAILAGVGKEALDAYMNRRATGDWRAGAHSAPRWTSVMLRHSKLGSAMQWIA